MYVSSCTCGSSSCGERTNPDSPVWLLFCFCLLFFSTGLKISGVLAGCDVWKVVLRGMSADVGCCSSAAPLFSSPRDFRPWELETHTQPCLVSVCLTRHKQNQCNSSVCFSSFGGSWSCCQFLLQPLRDLSVWLTCFQLLLCPLLLLLWSCFWTKGAGTVGLSRIQIRLSLKSNSFWHTR